MSVNLELYDQVLAHIEAHPEQWEQETWLEESECGTVGCFAGWAVVLGEGDRENVSSSASELLGLDHTQAGAIFSASQTLGGLRAWREILAEANLSGVNLRGANLREADLRGADLRGADLRGAAADAESEWPDGFDAGAAGVVMA